MLAQEEGSIGSLAMSYHPTTGLVRLNVSLGGKRSVTKGQAEGLNEGNRARHIVERLDTTLRESQNYDPLLGILRLSGARGIGNASEGLIEGLTGNRLLTEYGTQLFTHVIARLLEVEHYEAQTLRGV